MRVCFISRESLKEFLNGGYRFDADVVVCSFRFLGEVSYEKELDGETAFFEGVAQASKKYRAVVVAGCVTDAKGHKRKSAVVAENGRILGVSDTLNALDGETSAGANLRVYDTRVGKMGVCVAEDLYFPEVIKTLALCGSDFVVYTYDVAMGNVETALLRADAFRYGMPVFFCGVGYGAIVEPTGEVAFASPVSPVLAEYEPVKEYHLVETRRRGFYKAPQKEF